jgi:hypothetical protein
MSKLSHLNFSLNTHFFVTNISSANPYFLVHHFIIVTPAILFSISNNTMCHMFMILSYIYIFLSEPYLSIIPFSSCLSSITVSPAMPSTTSNTSSQMPSVNGRQPNNPTKQHLPWSGNVSTLLPPCCQPLPPLAACCLPLATQRWCLPSLLNAWSVIRL